MSVRKYKAGILLNKFLKLLFGGYMKLLFHYSIVNGDILRDIRPPYIVLANHTNFWDPFLLSICFPEPVYFVASDAYFRSPVLKQLLKLVGAIPKSKRISDPGSIRGILEVVKNKGIIGIFPEGKRNWDGNTLPLLLPTAKLIKSLGLPVITVLFKGACLTMPRWSTSTRKGPLVMEISKVLSPQRIKTLSTDEIFNIITNSVQHDEYEYQRIHMSRYTGKKRAELLERFLFTCPECNNIDSMESLGDLFGCEKCGYQVKYNTFGCFERDGGKLYFINPRDWNLWQVEQLKKSIEDSMNSGSPRPIVSEPHIIMRTGGKTGKLSKGTSEGILNLYPQVLVYISGDNEQLNFPLRDLSGINVQFNNQLEFSFKKVIHRFHLANGRMCAYKFVKAMDEIKIKTLEVTYE